MFETLTIHARDHALPRLDARPYASLDVTRPLGCLKLVKHLHLKAPFFQNLTDERCPHFELCGRGRLPRDPITGVLAWESNASLPKLIPLLVQLPENGLVSFNWDLGMCIPDHILGPEGYLTKKQTTIESLSLITGVVCWSSNPRQRQFNPPIITLSGFPMLRRLSWKGLQRIEELESLRAFFQSHYQMVEDLELDFIRWQIVQIWRLRPDKNPRRAQFTDIMLPHNLDGYIKRFTSLKRLALSGFAFDAHTRSFTHAFNVSNLQSLKLHNCKKILAFLSTIANEGLVLKLKSLELIIEDEPIERDGTSKSPLITLLQSFQGLEHLYLMLPSETARADRRTYCYWNAILHHSSTLKSLIYHERTVAGLMRPDQHWADKELFRGSNGIHLGTQERFYNSGLAQMRLESFGIAGVPDGAAVIMTESLAAKQHIKVLHFRRTGTDPPSLSRYTPDFETQIGYIIQCDPASWTRDEYLHNLRRTARGECQVLKAALEIFQSPKFDDLQILAFGDFSLGGR